MRSFNVAMIDNRSSEGMSGQRAISSSVRPHPLQSEVFSSMMQYLMHGVCATIAIIPQCLM